MYRLLDNNVIEEVPENYKNISGYRLFLQNLPIRDRQDLGWFSYLKEKDLLDKAYIDKENDTIIIPKTVNRNIEIDPRVLIFRNKYKEATNNLCKLAGISEKDKLDDIEYEEVVRKSLIANESLSTFLTQTIMYCLFQLYRLDGDDA